MAMDGPMDGLTDGLQTAPRTEAGALFLFPLQKVVFFPQTTKPLNIFEPRYVKMVNDAIESDRLVALACADPTRRLGREVGTLAHIRRIAGAGRVKLLERRADGTMMILLEGTGKVRLKTLVTTEEPYLIVDAVWVGEDVRLAEENLFLLNRMMKELAKWLARHVPDQIQRDAFLEQIKTPEEKINYLCSLMIADPELQQELLETDDLNERLRAVSLFLLDAQTLPH